MKYYSTEVLKHWIPTSKWLAAMESRQPKEVINVRFCRDCPLFEPDYWQNDPSITVGWCRRLSYYEFLDDEVPYYVYVNSNSFCNEDDINDDDM